MAPRWLWQDHQCQQDVRLDEFHNVRWQAYCSSAWEVESAEGEDNVASLLYGILK